MIYGNCVHLAGYMMVIIIVGIKLIKITYFSVNSNFSRCLHGLLPYCSNSGQPRIPNGLPYLSCTVEVVQELTESNLKDIFKTKYLIKRMRSSFLLACNSHWKRHDQSGIMYFKLCELIKSLWNIIKSNRCEPWNPSPLWLFPLVS